MSMRSVTQGEAGLLITIQLGISLGSAVLWASLNQGSYSPGMVVRVGCAILPIALLWCFVSWRRAGGELFSPYSLFVSSVFIFNAGQAVLECLGLNKDGILGNNFSQVELGRTLIFVLYSFSTLHFGALLAAARPPRPGLMNFKLQVAALRSVGYILVAVSIIPSAIVWGRAVRLVASGGYFALYQAKAATEFGASGAILAGFLIPGTFLLLAGSGGTGRGKTVATAIICAYVFVQFFLGFRANAVVVVSATVWLWHRTVKRVSLIVAAIFAAVAVLILPVIGVTRNIPGSERLSFHKVAGAYSEVENPIVALVSEMGGSMIASAYTIRLVPQYRGYELGATYAYAAFSLMPNLFWDVHPAVAHSPSKWLVEAVEPAVADAGGGLGYSVLAEGYLNFGFLGAAIPMVLIGWAVGSVSRWAESSTARPVACFAAIALLPLLVYARAESGNVLRGIVWFAGFPYLLVCRWPGRFSRGRQRSVPELPSK